MLDFAYAIPRASTEELTMQVLHDGAWHRRTPDLSSTACGDPLHSQYSPLRRETLDGASDGALCDRCHTEFELNKYEESRKAKMRSLNGHADDEEP